MIRWSVLDGSGIALAGGSADNPELGWHAARDAALSLVSGVSVTVALVMTVGGSTARVYPGSPREEGPDSLREIIDELVDVVVAPRPDGRP